MKDHFESVLRIIRAITFRYNVIGKLNPNELERAYNSSAIKVFKGSITLPQEIQKELQSVYVDDESFKNTFSTKYFDTNKTKEKKIIRYVLLSIENQEYNKDYHLFDTNVTIEHIYPENYFNKEEEIDNSMIYRLGNLALLEPSLNKKAGNKSFDQKKEIYKKSQYEMTKKLSENEEWKDESIRNRQLQLAKIAISIWRFPF